MSEISGDGFDWTNNPWVIVPAQQAVAVYRNDAGNVVIRTEADWPHEEADQFIVIDAVHAQAVAAAILDAAGIGIDAPLRRACADHAPSAPSVGALRQKRYRQRHQRDARDVTGDGGSSGSNVTQLPFPADRDEAACG